MAQSKNDNVVKDDKGGYRQINKTLNICAFDDYLNGQMALLPELADTEQLTPRVLRVLGKNPGKFTYQGTNTYIVGTGPRRVIIDTGGGEQDYKHLIAATLESLGITLTHILLTHWHGDHTGGVPGLLELYPHLQDSVYKNDPDFDQQDIVDGQIFRVEGATIRAIHVPGHSDDHVCFILEEERAMFTGDNILGHGTSVVEDLGTFMTSLQRMHAESCIIGYSAHGETIADLPGKIKRDLDGRLRREKQVVMALGRIHGRGEKSVPVSEVVTQIYGTAVDEMTRSMALEPFFDEVLRKLAGDFKVAFKIRAGKKQWYLIEQQSTEHQRDIIAPAFVDSQVRVM